MSTAAPSTVTRSLADEETPLLGRNGADGGKSDAHAILHRMRRYMQTNVNRNWADVVLILCYMITGLLDSSAVFIWGSFVSMQTGEFQHHNMSFFCLVYTFLSMYPSYYESFLFVS